MCKVLKKKAWALVAYLLGGKTLTSTVMKFEMADSKLSLLTETTLCMRRNTVVSSYL